MKKFAIPARHAQRRAESQVARYEAVIAQQQRAALSALQDLQRALNHAPRPTLWDRVRAFCAFHGPAGSGKPDLEYWMAAVRLLKLAPWRCWTDEYHPPAVTQLQLTNAAVLEAYERAYEAVGRLAGSCDEAEYARDLLAQLKALPDDGFYFHD